MNSIASTNWRAFLRIDENKTELIRILSQHSLSLTEGNSTVLYAYDNVFQSNETKVDIHFLLTCNHEEADTFFPACKGYGSKWLQKICIRTKDTDVVILASA